MILSIALLVLISMAVGWLASRKYSRSFWGWSLLAVFITPLLALVGLAIAGKASSGVTTKEG
jgi:hypothetical protein